MISSTLVLLRYLVMYMNVKQGSSLNRGQSPVEWGEILSICPSVDPPRSLSQAKGGPSQAVGGQSQ